MHRALPVLLALLLPLAAAAQPAGSSSSGDPTLDRTIKKANTDWIVSMSTGDAAKAAEPFEDDAVFVTLDGTSIHGRAEIEAMMKERFAHGGLAAAAKIEPRRIVRDGDLAVEIGAAEIRRLDAAGKEVVTGGRCLTVWRRQGDGAWRIHRNLVLP